MAPLTLGVFGAFQVTRSNGSSAKFESDKTRALLAYLAVESDRPHRREALLGLLWPEESEPTARQNLRQALYSLRQSIGDSTARPPYLHITREDIQFNTTSKFALDLASFNAHLAATTTHAHARLDGCGICAPHLQQAIDLYRGKFLQEFFLEDSAEFEAWAMARREELHQRALEALANLGNYYEQSGDLGAARLSAARALELDPWREQAHRQLMRVYAREGQVGAAIAQFETCRRVLADELGVEPSSETRELVEQIKAGNWAQPSASSSTVQATRGATNLQLPTHLTPFIGRERELQDLGRLIADPSCRLLTLVGPGGMGKTRLAIQAAANQRDTFSQGVAFVPLVGVESDEAVVPAIAEALGFSFYGATSPRVQLLNHLREKQMLLVLDNVEQLLEAADLFVEILERTTELKLLLTSREPLNVQGEWVFPVEGLQMPEHDRVEEIESSAAVALFVQRAQRARVGFALNPPDLPRVARLCHLVDGNPLALELAATWVRTLSLAEIVAEIERDLNFLSAPVRDLPERHRSMRVVFDRSWEMLAPEERRVLRELSAFHGRFQRQAAEQVAGATLATLSALVAKSLVRRTDTGHYDLHDLVRQYAGSKLGEDDLAKVSERHGRYYLDWLGRKSVGLRDQRQKETAAELVAEVDNLLTAWDWAVEHFDLTRVREASTALWYLFELRTWLAEGETLFRKAAETLEARIAQSKPDDADLLTVHAMRAHSAYFSFRIGKSAAAHAALQPSVEYLRASADPVAGTYALWYLGIVSWELGKFAEAKQSFQASLEKARACNEHWWVTFNSEFIGIVAHATGEYELARRYFTEALAGAREMGDPMVIAHVLIFLSQTLRALGQTEPAGNFLSESLTIAQEIGYRHGIGRALDGLGQLAQADHPDKARDLFAASAGVFREIGDLGILSVVLCHQGYNLVALGEVAAAQQSFGEVIRLTREGGYIPFALDALLGLAIIDAQNSDAGRALELVTHVLHNPATTHDAKARAEKLGAEIELRLTPQQIHEAQAWAQKANFDEVVSRALEEVPVATRTT